MGPPQRMTAFPVAQVKIQLNLWKIRRKEKPTEQPQETGTALKTTGSCQFGFRSQKGEKNK